MAAALALTASARTFTVTAWRGETAAALVPDFCELGNAPEGISLRFGSLKGVKYAPKPNSVQRLEALDRVDWSRRLTCPRIVEVKVPTNAAPGVYRCGMMEVKVLDRVLPPAKDWKYFLDLWQHPWAVSRFWGVEPFSKAHYDRMRPLWQLLATAGQKTITVTMLPEAWDHQCYDAYGTMIGRVRHDDGTWSFDYRVFDEYVEFAKSCGLGPNIACYTMCPWGYVCRYQNDRGETVAVECRPGTPAFKDYWDAFLVDFARHLKAKGWLKDVYIAMDERSVEDVKMIGEFIRERVPEMRISMAGNQMPSQYGVKVDDFCMILGDKITDEYRREAAARRAQGMVTTYYVCCWPIYPNTFMSSGEGEAFWLGAYPAACGLDGFLRWAWNSWPQDPFRDATYWNWLAGDTYLVYPDGAPSWRFLELRNGIVAAEKARILREQGVNVAELDKAAKLFDRVKAMANTANFVEVRRQMLEAVNPKDNGKSK